MRVHSRFVIVLGCLASLFLTHATYGAVVCKVSESGFSAEYRGDVSKDLNDYGRIHYDANISDCAPAAEQALILKIRNVLAANPYEYRDWLRGAQVSLIFASALRLGSFGYATQELDVELRRVESQYSLINYIDPNCDETSNQCLDDFAIAASGHAWIAAYKNRRMDSSSSVVSARNKANYFKDLFFSAICISTTSNPTSFCDGDVWDIGGDDDGYTYSMNHDQQMPSYGFGLLTSIASTVVGLEASGANVSFTSDQLTLAWALAYEMQKHVDIAPVPDVYRNDCWQVAWNGGVWIIPDANRPCGGPDAYEPEMYALYNFYNEHFISFPTAPDMYLSNLFRKSSFDLSDTSTRFFSFGRYEIYYRHAYLWVTNEPEWMPKDNYDPIGFLEQVSPTGLVQGWTCDKDASSKSNVVEIYADNAKVAVMRAEASSEDAIATECRGGSAHRFWFQMSGPPTGAAITAYGNDYTWFGRTQLACLQSPACKW